MNAVMHASAVIIFGAMFALSLAIIAGGIGAGVAYLVDAHRIAKADRDRRS
jgi:hypothetical protein